MSKQVVKLLNVLSASGNTGVSVIEIAKALNIKEKSVPTYLHNLKKNHKVNIGAHKDGKRILRYYLIDYQSSIESPVEQKKHQIEIFPILDEDVDALSDKEFMQIKASLGIEG
jgi:predicted transcriptional regulator